jgi:hypothetical protein
MVYFVFSFQVLHQRLWLGLFRVCVPMLPCIIALPVQNPGQAQRVKIWCARPCFSHNNSSGLSVAVTCSSRSANQRLIPYGNSQRRLSDCPDGDINFHKVRRSSLFMNFASRQLVRCLPSPRGDQRWTSGELKTLIASSLVYVLYRLSASIY